MGAVVKTGAVVAGPVDLELALRLKLLPELNTQLLLVLVVLAALQMRFKEIHHPLLVAHLHHLLLRLGLFLLAAAEAAITQQEELLTVELAVLVAEARRIVEPQEQAILLLNLQPEETELQRLHIRDSLAGPVVLARAVVAVVQVQQVGLLQDRQVVTEVLDRLLLLQGRASHTLVVGVEPEQQLLALVAQEVVVLHPQVVLELLELQVRGAVAEVVQGLHFLMDLTAVQASSSSK